MIEIGDFSQVITAIATKFNTDSYSANQTNSILYEDNRILNDYVTYSNGSFTVKKAGYYELKLYAYILGGSTDGTAKVIIRKTGADIMSSQVYFRDSYYNTGITVNGIEYLNVGDVITTIATYTKSFKTQRSTFTMLYHGNNL